MVSFHRKYFWLAFLIFVIEVFIAIFIHDDFIRPYVGDFLVVILIYCFVRSFLHAPIVKTALAVLLFSYLVEISQYFSLVARLGLQNSRMANLILGNSFQWVDMVAYTLGIGLIIILEKPWRPVSRKGLRSEWSRP